MSNVLCNKCRRVRTPEWFSPGHKVCKPCRNAACRKWRASKPNYEKERYQRTKVETRERHLIRKYGVTLAAYAAMLDDQHGCCAICMRHESENNSGVLHVDHDHVTGKVRGLLCTGCNHLLGHLSDSVTLLQAAIDYLKTSRRAA